LCPHTVTLCAKTAVFPNKVTQQNIRIKDIAKMAGVSEGTVDRILHGRPNVSAKSLAKVNAVLEKINYKPNLIARSLGTGKNIRVVVLLPASKNDPYWSEANSGIAQAQDEWSHYGITIESFQYAHDGQSSLEHVGQVALKSKTDGVVMAPIFYQQALTFLNKLNEHRIPYVLFNDNIPESTPISFIGQDLWQSGKLAGELMSLGHGVKEDIVILHIGEDVKDSVYLAEKEKGFRDFYQSNGTGPSSILTLNLHDNGRAISGKIEHELKNKNLKGMFVTTSKSTSVVASVLTDSKRKDVRLVGYDLLEDNLKYLKSGAIRFLINQNPKRQAFLGVSHIVNHLLFKKKVPSTELFPLEIITQQNVDSYITSPIH
jgi:LacI family transcriptional regulator